MGAAPLLYLPGNIKPILIVVQRNYITVSPPPLLAATCVGREPLMQLCNALSPSPNILEGLWGCKMQLSEMFFPFFLIIPNERHKYLGGTAHGFTVANICTLWGGEKSPTRAPIYWEGQWQDNEPMILTQMHNN